MPVFGKKYPEGFRKCDYRFCKGGYIQQFVEVKGRLKKAGKKKCPYCGGSGMIRK